MATRTEPIAAASFLMSPLRGVRMRHGLVGGADIYAGRAPGPFGGDQLFEPTDLALTRLEPVALQLERVGVEPLGRAGQDVAQALPALLDPPAPALEDAKAGLLVGPGEEREVHTERGVVEGLRPGLDEQLLEALLAFRGDLVNHPSTTARH